MTPVSWARLGPREKQVLAILRRSDGPLTVREVLEALVRDGDEIAYTTVSTILDRLVEKDVLRRSEEVHGGSRRYRYRFEVEEHLRELVAGIVDDVELVLGDAGLAALAEEAADSRTTVTE